MSAVEPEHEHPGAPDADECGGYERPDPERPASASPTQPVLEHETPGGMHANQHDPYSALRFPPYRLFCAGWLLSVIGQQIQTRAVEWDIYTRVRAMESSLPKLRFFGHPLDPALLAMGLVGLVLATPIIL